MQASSLIIIIIRTKMIEIDAISQSQKKCRIYLEIDNN